MFIILLSCRNIVVTGGSAIFPGFQERLEREEIQQLIIQQFIFSLRNLKYNLI